MRRVWAQIAVEPGTKKDPRRVFALKMSDQKTYGIYGICFEGIPSADQAEKMFETLWEKCEKDQALD